MSDKDDKIPKSLKDALIAGEVVPFVGAGVSMSVKKKTDDGTKSDESLFPSWKGFVETLAEALREENKSDEANYVLSSIKIKKPKYLDALQHAQKELGERLWYKLFDESFDRSKDEAHPDSLRLNELIWELSNNLIITTNVDRIFQWTCPQPSEFRILDVQYTAYAELQKERMPKRPTVWYLHGHIDHKEKVVFTREQFEDFYKQKGNEAKLQTLLSFLTQRAFLFIGFSLDDDYLRELLEYVHNLYKGGADSFYILFRERDIPTANFPEYVKPIPFSDFDKPLEDLVEELTRIAKSGGDIGKVNSDGDKSKTPKDSKIKTDKPFFNVPFASKGKEFVGRVGKIEEIWDLLNADGCASIGQAVSVKGFGGLGKTQLAVEYAHAFRDRYKNGVFWLVADQPLDTQLLQIGDEMGWTAQADEQTNQLEAAIKCFLALSDCLILFDNVETFAGIKDLLPKASAQTHILITSREKIYEFAPVNLELLDRNESRELLLKIAKREPTGENEKEHLEQILEILGDIPLAIELVGGYLAEHETVTFEKYHQFLDEVPFVELEKKFPKGSFTNHDRSIIQTLRISEKTIKEKPLMVEILKVLAWSGSSSMGKSLLQALVEPESEFEFETAIGDAHKLRLLKKDEDEERYAIHRLLAKVIQYENPLEEQKKWHKKIAGKLRDWFRARYNKFEYLTEFESEIEHLEVWQENIIDILPEQAVNLLSYRGSIPYQRGIYQTGFNYYEEALNLYNRENLSDKLLFAFLQNEIGLVLGYLGKHEEELKYQLQSLEIRRELFGEKHPETATSLNNVGSTYGELGNHEEALKYQLQSLEIRRELFGEKHPDTANSLNNVGGTYGELGNHEEALKYQLQSLEIRRELFGKKHPLTATSLNNVGYTYGNLGNHEEALKYKLQSLEIRRELFGEKHPLTANSLNNVGGTYGELGNHEEALKYLLQSLEIYRELFGEKHPSTASSLNNVGYTYGNLGNHEEALKYQLQSLEIHQELLGKQHPNTIHIAKNLINTYLKRGEKEKAGRKAAEYFSYIPQDHPYWEEFEELSRPYRQE